MKVYNTLKNNKNVITGYGFFDFTSEVDAKLAIQLAEAHAENVLKCYHNKTSKLLHKAINQFD
jgi:hypothetical protein